MILSITVNMQKYESVKLTTSEHETIEECFKELVEMAIYLDNYLVKQFIIKHFEKPLDKLAEEKEKVKKD